MKLRVVIFPYSNEGDLNSGIRNARFEQSDNADDEWTSEDFDNKLDYFVGYDEDKFPENPYLLFIEGANYYLINSSDKKAKLLELIKAK